MYIVLPVCFRDGASQSGLYIVLRVCFRDGASQSGVYITSSCLLEGAEQEQEVDVFHMVQTVRDVRSQFIADMVRFLKKHFNDIIGSLINSHGP